MLPGKGLRRMRPGRAPAGLMSLLKAFVVLLAVGAVVGAVKLTTTQSTRAATATQGSTAASAQGSPSSGTFVVGSCKNGRSVDWFNATSSWGAGQGKIGPGTTVLLCGTITSPLAVQGSGAPGNPITLAFEPGAALSEPYCSTTSGCLSIVGQSYVTVDGGNVGVIEATANGTGLANQQADLGIYLQNTSHIVVENLTIENLYVHSSPGDSSLSAKSQYAIEDFDGNDNRITGNTIHDTQVGVYYRTDPGYGRDNEVDDNDFYDIDNPVNQTYQFAGGSTGPFFFDHNYLHDFQNWDTSADTYHHDGVHCYTSETNGSPVHSVGFYYYDNMFEADGGSGSDFTSFFYIEGGDPSSPGSTPCDDPSSDNYFFNNVLIDRTSGGLSNGVMAIYAGVDYVLNNTMIGASDAGGGPAVARIFGAGGVLMENNVLSTGDQLINANPGEFVSGDPDYNLYAAGGDNAFVCGSNYLAHFGQWRSCIGADRHSAFRPSADLTVNGLPLATSPARGLGVNLTPLCSGLLSELCSDYLGNGRPSTGPWDAGAFDWMGHRPPSGATALEPQSRPAHRSADDRHCCHPDVQLRAHARRHARRRARPVLASRRDSRRRRRKHGRHAGHL